MSPFLVWCQWSGTGKTLVNLWYTFFNKGSSKKTALQHDKHAAKKPIITLETHSMEILLANHIQTKRQSLRNTANYSVLRLRESKGS